MIEKAFTYLRHTKSTDRDTLLRARIFFIPIADDKAELKQIAPILAPSPINLPVEKIKMDPVILQSIWKGGDYINLRLKHTFPASPRQPHYWGIYRSRPSRTNAIHNALSFSEWRAGALYARSLSLLPIAAVQYPKRRFYCHSNSDQARPNNKEV